MIRYRFRLDFGIGGFHPHTVSVIRSEFVLSKSIPKIVAQVADFGIHLSSDGIHTYAGMTRVQLDLGRLTGSMPSSSS
jgi:hypothetical protein